MNSITKLFDNFWSLKVSISVELYSIEIRTNKTRKEFLMKAIDTACVIFFLLTFY